MPNTRAHTHAQGSPGGARGKEPSCHAGDVKDMGSALVLGRSPWRRKWQPTPVFLPGEAKGQRSLMGYSPWCRKESDMTERLSTVDTSALHSQIRYLAHRIDVLKNKDHI